MRADMSEMRGFGGGNVSEFCVLRELYLTMKPYLLRALPFGNTPYTLTGYSLTTHPIS